MIHQREIHRTFNFLRLFVLSHSFTQCLSLRIHFHIVISSQSIYICFFLFICTLFVVPMCSVCLAAATHMLCVFCLILAIFLHSFKMSVAISVCQHHPLHFKSIRCWWCCYRCCCFFYPNLNATCKSRCAIKSIENTPFNGWRLVWEAGVDMVMEKIANKPTDWNPFK